MKKTIYTIAFIALFSAFANAQDTKQVKQDKPVQATTTDVAPAAAADNAQAQDNSKPAATKETKTEAKPAAGTRMAITEKGVPASKKAAEPKKSEPAKTEKH